jgi:hypothetical protein
MRGFANEQLRPLNLSLIFNSLKELWFNPNGVRCGKVPDNRTDSQFDQTFVEPSNWKHSAYTTPEECLGFSVRFFHPRRNFDESNAITDFHGTESQHRTRSHCFLQFFSIPSWQIPQRSPRQRQIDVRRFGNFSYHLQMLAHDLRIASYDGPAERSSPSERLVVRNGLSHDRKHLLASID